jgi:hypothetical protein
MEKYFQLPSSSQNRETYSSFYVTYFEVVLCYLHYAVLCLHPFGTILIFSELCTGKAYQVSRGQHCC